MTKEEYQDFVLRYKGCGACFPNYYTLSQEEKLWFSAIQKDVTELEKKNAELKEKIEVLECDNYNANCNLNLITDQLTKATDLLKKMYYLYHDPCVTHKDLENRDKLFEEVKQFIKE